MMSNKLGAMKIQADPIAARRTAHEVDFGLAGERRVEFTGRHASVTSIEAVSHVEGWRIRDRR